ncbi:hypothetical protein F0562_029194 [Nyssa sinensis]|uniref:Uncharacterized protein n=1 Tax=Nyssa sinensis TaxID=561372 RepID=A0A5J5B399_9ASTE|nr:hypothetical protein F0562_029194 [Nyssa sinensis]
MLQCIFFLSDSGVVMLEKQLTGHRVDRSICAWFWEQAISQGDSFKLVPVIASPTHYLFQIVREGITFLACRQVEMPPLMGIEEAWAVNYLLSKRGRRGNLEGLQEVIIGGETGLVDKHASIEVERRPGPQLGGPLDLIWALLAVANLVLWAVTPRFLTEAVHHRIEIAIWHVEEVIDVLVHLDVSVQVYHLAVLHKL